MDAERLNLYEKLEERIGNTPLVPYVGKVQNGNRIWIKRECDNLFGSHYDRVYLALFRHFEESGEINSHDRVLETTTGAAGVSFAGIGKVLGFECHVAMPAGGEKAREQAIEQQRATLYLTPAEEYVNAFPRWASRFLVKNREFTFLNHSMGPVNRGARIPTNNEITLRALEGIAREVMEDINVDLFIPAVGNGSSVLGPGRVFNSQTQIVSFEPFQSAVAYDQLYPGRYEKKFGIKPGTLSRHRLPGTSYQGIDFPHVRDAIKSCLVDKAILVSDSQMDAEYHSLTGRNATRELPHWDMSLNDHKDLGRSTRAGIAVSLRLAEGMGDKDMLIIAYDKASRYDS